MTNTRNIIILLLIQLLVGSCKQNTGVKDYFEGDWYCCIDQTYYELHFNRDTLSIRSDVNIHSIKSIYNVYNDSLKLTYIIPSHNYFNTIEYSIISKDSWTWLFNEQNILVARIVDTLFEWYDGEFNRNYRQTKDAIISRGFKLGCLDSLNYFKGDTTKSLDDLDL